MDLASLFIVGFIGALAPGPDNLVVLHTSLRFGARGGLRVLGGIATGWVIFLALVYFGFNRFLGNEVFRIIFSLLGGGYLIYIAVQLLKKTKAPVLDSKKGAPAGYLQGLVINLSNPKALLFFSVVITPFMNDNLATSIVVLYASLLSGFGLVIFAAVRLCHLLNERIFRLIDRLCALLFGLFGLALFYQGAEGLRLAIA